MKIKFNKICICLLCLLMCQSSWPAEDFGRLFTTPNQRQQLDELRKTQTDIKIEVQDDELTIDQGPVVEAATTGELRLKGLVYRNDGKNTAWINDSNSYEGDLASQYVRVSEEGVAADQVIIEMGGEESEKLPLRVGQSYNPGDGTVRDLVPEAGKPAAPNP